ncbi:flagellar basal body-associated protein FliL [Vibrio sp. TH_r3]|uniref:flagellar basal body-associated protein FliL n=1 Tax=Vibrio sp. TH_r3 TaxID=3082084 RepID=UPI0029534766|nr:flagellar basal body-associated protein FliL [Vibrio sp. TH_r3]MDV7106044.1 flagellar basal body-associated protein FliL [Vibrio sp. TH_r3]
MLKRYVTLLFFILTSTCSTLAVAEEEQNGPTFAYYTLSPDLTTNVYAEGQRLAYLQVRVDLMVADSAYVAELEQHAPLIRDAIVEQIGQLTQEQAKTLAGREALRKQLKDSLNNLLVAETGKTLIADLLFTKYLYQ